MKRIDTSKWKEFRVGDLFVTEKDGKQVPTGASIPKLELKEKGSTPRISVTGLNNGILGYFDYQGANRSNYRVYNNFISVSFLGTVFYQKGSASLDMKVHCLKPLEIELNDYSGSFLVAAIKASLKNYAYSDQLSSTVLPNIYIKLPHTSYGTPDWEFMEDCMRKKEQQTSTSIKALKRLTQSHKPKRIDTSNWREFSLIELFEIKLSEGDNKANLLEEGQIPLISSGSFNNGIAKYIKEGDGKSKMFEGNVITVDMFGKAFYQDKPFFAVSHGRVNILEPKFENNSYIGLFISSIIDTTLFPKYNFAVMCNQSQLQKEKIYLPSTSNGTPDWELMEQYMRQVELQVRNSIIALTTPAPQIQQQGTINNYGTVNIYEK